MFSKNGGWLSAVGRLGRTSLARGKRRKYLGLLVKQLEQRVERDIA